MAGWLFHVSEEPGIAVFEPRPVPSLDAGVSGNAVWAIDEDHLPNYLLPRECPRVTYAAGPNTSAADIERWFDNTKARRIVVIEQRWLQIASHAVLYVYELPGDRFAPADRSAGYFISREAVAPVAVREVRDPLGEIAARGCELRAVPGLWPIRDGVMASTLDYSIIRMRNAARLG
jgi:hypothetical protein